MHHAVRTLEALARDPQLAIDAATAGLAPELRAALRAGDADTLARLLGRPGTYACMILPAENDEPGEPARAPDAPDEDDAPGESDA